MAVVQSQTILHSSLNVLFDGKGLERVQTSRSPLLPPGAFDTHVHVFDPTVGPYAPNRAYTPESAPLSNLLAFSGSVSTIQQPLNLVIVQPSPYKTDNRVLLSSLEFLRGNGSFVRGIAVVDVNSVTDDELDYMNDLGVRGLRLNMQSDGHGVNMQALKNLMVRAAARISRFTGWKLQLFAPAYVWEDLYETILGLPVTVIADHTGGLLAASKLEVEQHLHPLRQPGFESLVALAKASKVVIKISGLYRSSSEETTGFADMAPLIRELAFQVRDSLIWASDWPHTGEGRDRLNTEALKRVEPFRKIDNEKILINLRKWVGTEDNWMKMMVHNPRRVFE